MYTFLRFYSTCHTSLCQTRGPSSPEHAEFGQKHPHGRTSPTLHGGMCGQPLLRMLFRPEEVVLPSAAASINVGPRRGSLGQLAPMKHQTDAIRAVSARIINHDPLIGVSAADQQQEVDCSGNVEPFAVLQSDRMEVEAQARQKAFVPGGQAASCSWSLSRISASAVCHSSAKITGSFPASSAGRTTCSLIKGGADSANYAAFRPLRHTLPPDDGR